MNMNQSAYKSALAIFTQHSEALTTVEQIHRQSDAVGERLNEQANASKPDFSAISRLHSERDHLANKLLKMTASIAALETKMPSAGQAVYNEVNNSRDLAGDAAVELVHSRLAADYPETDVRGFVARRHPVLIAEDGRRGYTPSPCDIKTPAEFAARVPDMVLQIEQALNRQAIYKTATVAGKLPDAKKLDAQTHETGRPFVLRQRVELTAAQEQARDDALVSAENKHLENLFHQGRAIGGEYNENADALLAFISKHPEVAKFFPHRRVNAAA